MRIRSFSIDRFGILSDQRVEALAPGLTVFLGRNEAGKSTCLNFFRAMLFGYARNRRSIDYQASGGMGGGCLDLDTAMFGPLLLTRRPGPHGGPLTLTGVDGQPRSPDDLDALLRGCTPDLYDKVFAFSLGELSHFGSLTDDRIRHALHGAAFGLGLRSPAQVLKRLEDEARRIFTPRASTSTVHKLLAEYGEVCAAVAAKGNEVDEYSRLRTQLAEVSANLEDLRGQRAAGDAERRGLEVKISLQRRWNELRAAEDAVAALPPVPGHFTADGRERLDRLLDRLEERRETASSARMALERAEGDLREIPARPGLLEAAPAIFALAERKETMRSALRQATAWESEKAAAERQAEAMCRVLGPEWDACSVRQADVSMAAHEICRTTGRRLAEAERSLEAANRERKRLEDERNLAAQALDEAVRSQEQGNDCGMTLLPEEEAETLTELLVRAVEAHERLGSLALAARNAEQALEHEIAAIDPGWSRQDLEAADLAPGSRDRLLALAGDAVKAEENFQEAEREQQVCLERRHELASRVEGLRAVLAAGSGKLADAPGQDHDLSAAASLLETRARLAASARQLLDDLAAAREAYAATTEQLGDLTSLARSAGGQVSWPLLALLLSVVGLVCGLGLSAIGLSRGHESLLYAAVATLAASAALGTVWWVLARGKGSSETRDHWSAIERRLIRARSEAQRTETETEAALHALAEQAPTLFPGGKVEWDAVRGIEQKVAAGRQILAVLERDAAELDRERNALAQAVERLDQAGTRVDETSAQLEQCLQRWRAALERYGLPPDTRPDGAMRLLEKLDAAKARRFHLHARLGEQEACQAKLRDCLHFACSIPDLADGLASLPEPDSHLAPDHGPWLDLVREYAAAQRSAGREYLRRTELASARRSRLDEIGRALETAGTQADDAKAEYETAREGWQNWLRDNKLASTLSPETGRMALEAVARAREILDKAVQLGERLESVRQEAHSFRTEAVRCAAMAGKQDVATVDRDGPVPDVAADVFGLVDRLAEQARLAREDEAIRMARQRELPRLRDAMTLAEQGVTTVQAEVDAILARACCPDPESFRQTHAVWDAREKARTEERRLRAAAARETAEAGLSLEQLQTFFSGTTPDALAERLRDAETAVSGLLAREAELARETGRLEAAMAALTSESDLAELLARRESLADEIGNQAREWSTLTMARSLLLAAKKRFESERQTGVVASAGRLFREITGGAYQGLAISLDDEAVAAIAADGRRLDAEKELSRGTREQLYLAVRLAYILDHGDQAEALPVIMDDILVNFDPQRAANTAYALGQIGERHQVLFFTCHPWTADILLEACPGAVLCAMDGGVMTAS